MTAVWGERRIDGVDLAGKGHSITSAAFFEFTLSAKGARPGFDAVFIHFILSFLRFTDMTDPVSCQPGPTFT